MKLIVLIVMESSLDILYSIPVTGGMIVTVNISATTSVVIDGLIKFRLYSFSVAAINDNGIGPYSNKQNVLFRFALCHVLY